MREIIFRGKKKGKWIYGYYNHYKPSDIHEIISEEYGCIGVEVEKETIGQFTGLLDKHEQPIYEGDRLIHNIQSEFLDVSDWEQVEGNVCFIDGEWCVAHSQYPLYAFENEIIGNIHEINK